MFFRLHSSKVFPHKKCQKLKLMRKSSAYFTDTAEQNHENESEEKSGMAEWRAERSRGHRKDKKNMVKEGMTGSREREREGIQCSGPACGNSDAVFMDVYLLASPPGSSHFPLGDGWSPGETFLLHLKVVWPSDRRMHERMRC